MTERQIQWQIDRDSARETETVSERQGQCQRDRDSVRETETVTERQRQWQRHNTVTVIERQRQ